MIIWLASYPRSGNSFTRSIIQRCFGVAITHAIYPGEYGEVGTSDLEAFRLSPEPFFVKTHERPCDQSPALYIYRDGRDSLISYAHFLKAWQPELVERPWEELLEELIHGKLGFGDWSEHIAAWQLHSLTTRTAWVSYEELLENPVAAVHPALKRLSVSLEPTNRALPDFSVLQASRPHIYRKGKAGSWREEMPTRLVELFEERHALTMRSLGYPLEMDESRSLYVNHASRHAA